MALNYGAFRDDNLLKRRSVNALAAGGPAPPQPQQPAGPSVKLGDWESVRGGLNKFSDELDDAAKAQLHKLNKRTEALREARESGKIRDQEFSREQAKLSQLANDYPWEHHVKEKGAEIGDIVDDNGIQKMRTDKGFEVVGYTPEYIERNTVQVDDDTIAVPTERGSYKLVEKPRPERNIEREIAGIEEARKAIGTRTKEMAELLAKEREAQGINKPVTMGELNELSVLAKDLYLKQSMQAKEAYKTMVDGGVDDVRQHAVHGNAADPIKMELDMAASQRVENQREELKYLKRLRDVGQAQITPGAVQMRSQFDPVLEQRIANAEASLGVAPGSPVPSPDPGGPQPGVVDGVNTKAGAPSLASFMAGGKDKDERPTPHVRDTFRGRLESGAKTKNYYTAGSKAEMNSNVEGYQDGDTVQLADGRRYVKDGGQFWQVPTAWVTASHDADSATNMPVLTGPGSTAGGFGFAGAGPDKPASQQRLAHAPSSATPQVMDEAMSDQALIEQGFTEEEIAQAKKRKLDKAEANKVVTPPPLLDPVVNAGETQRDVGQRLASKWFRLPTLLKQMSEGPVKITPTTDPASLADGTIVIGEGKGKEEMAMKWGNELFPIEFDTSKFNTAMKNMLESEAKAKARRKRIFEKKFSKARHSMATQMGS